MRHELKPNDRVRITMEAGGVAQVRMIRADKMNALDPGMSCSALPAAISASNIAGSKSSQLNNEPEDTPPHG